MVGILLLNSYKVRNFYENLQFEEGQDFSFLINFPQMVGFHFKDNLQSWEFSQISCKLRNLESSNLTSIPQIPGFGYSNKPCKVGNFLSKAAI